MWFDYGVIIKHDFWYVLKYIFLFFNCLLDGVQFISNDEAIGDIFYNFIDKDGKKIGCEWNERTMSISFEEYKQIPLKIAVAGGVEKVEAINATLKNKLVDVLIIDEDTAVKMLNDKVIS